MENVVDTNSTSYSNQNLLDSGGSTCTANENRKRWNSTDDDDKDVLTVSNCIWTDDKYNEQHSTIQVTDVSIRTLFPNNNTDNSSTIGIDPTFNDRSDRIVSSSTTATTTSITATRISGLVLFYASWNTTSTTTSKNATVNGKQKQCRQRLVSQLITQTITNQGYYYDDDDDDDDNDETTTASTVGYTVQVDKCEEDISYFIHHIDQHIVHSNQQTVIQSLFELPFLAVLVQQQQEQEQQQSFILYPVQKISSIDIMQYLRQQQQQQQAVVYHTNVSSASTTYSRQSAMNDIYRTKIVPHVRQMVHIIEDQYRIVSRLPMILSTTKTETEATPSLSSSSSLSNTAIRIMIAGDKSSVGKSSICLGMIGALLQSPYNYLPEHIAYIKPATQSESPSLIQYYCDLCGIECIPIGPLVYYRGFTRAFLAKEVGTTQDWLNRCSYAVDRIARNKRIVLIDGVGFPAVGSICGTSNATMAIACGYPILQLNDNNNQNTTTTITTTIQNRKPMGVVLVGGVGVGAAIDAFNLNATYFEQFHVPVLGCIFNKLPLSGYYSLENCKEQITSYFAQQQQQQEQNKNGRHVYGFVPLFPRITTSGSSATNMKNTLFHVNEFIQLFRAHVDIGAIITAAKQVRDDTYLFIDGAKHDYHNYKQNSELPAQKKYKVVSSVTKSSTQSVTCSNDVIPLIRNRQQIEQEAISYGAAPSA